MNHAVAPVASLLAAWSIRRQKATHLRDPVHWQATVTDEGSMRFDGVDLATLTERFDSPLMVVSRTKLLADARRFRAAVDAHFPGALPAFSYKTNCIPGVLRELHEAGYGAEVISRYELWLAEKLGVPGTRIVVNGVNKCDRYLSDAVRMDVASINIDEGHEIELLRAVCHKVGKKARVSLRLKLNSKSHFGLSPDNGEALDAARRIAASTDELQFVGLHFHELADNDDPRPHVDHLHAALRFAAAIRTELNLDTMSLNVGGGYTVPTMKVMSRFEYARQRLFGVPASPPDPAPGDIAGYMKELARGLDAGCTQYHLPRPRILLEPGRVVTSQSHVLLTRVHSIKRNGNGPDFAMTDAGKILTSYPCDYEYHQMFAANRMGAPLEATYQLMGRLCTSADWLAKHRQLPRLERGDVIAIMDAGAYFTSYASNFAFPRPEIVMLDSGEVRTIRHGETFGHLTAMDV